MKLIPDIGFFLLSSFFLLAVTSNPHPAMTPPKLLFPGTMMLQFRPFSMISIEFKAEFRRARRETVKNAVARRSSMVFEDSLPGITIFPKKHIIFNKKYVNIDKAHEPILGA